MLFSQNSSRSLHFGDQCLAFLLLLDEQDVVDGDVSDAAVRHEPLLVVNEKFGCSRALGVGTQQQQEVQQQQ